jgi:hypothetical protein
MAVYTSLDNDSRRKNSIHEDMGKKRAKRKDDKRPELSYRETKTRLSTAETERL